MSIDGEVVPAGRHSFLGTTLRTIAVSVIYGPLAAVLAVGGLASIWYSGYLPFPRPMPLLDGLVILNHAIFIGVLYAIIALAPRPLPSRIAPALRLTLRALPHLALLLVLLSVAVAVSPYVWLVAWAPACFLAIPAHFAAYGWRGWITLPNRSPVSVVTRLVVLAPSALFLAVMTEFLSDPELDWGFMDGGVILGAFLGAAMFWAAFSCAIFSAQFARPPAPYCGGS